MDNRINSFSTTFLKKFNSELPEYEKYTKNIKIESDGAIVFTIPSQSTDDLNIMISTEGEDIILAFDGWHWHLYVESDKNLAALKKQINEIVNEDLICCEYKNFLFKKHSLINRDHYNNLKTQNKIVSSYSWKGTYNYNLR